MNFDCPFYVRLKLISLALTWEQKENHLTNTPPRPRNDSDAKGESQVERQTTRSNTNDPSYSHHLVSRDNDNGCRALFPYTKLPAMKLEVEVVAIG